MEPTEKQKRLTLLRVASIQLPRLISEDRAALIPHVKRDIEAVNG